jgi:hypothetical protein
MIFAVSFAWFDFCNKFCLVFVAAKICVFSVFIYAFLCAPIFLAQLF